MTTDATTTSPLSRCCTQCFSLPGTLCVYIDNLETRRTKKAGHYTRTVHHVRRDDKVEMWPWTYTYWIDEIHKHDRHRLRAWLIEYGDILSEPQRS